MMHRNLVEKVGGWRNYRCPDDDGEFFARMVLASSGITTVPLVLNFYFQSNNVGSHLSKSKNRKYIKNTLLTIDLKYNYLKRVGERKGIDRAIAAQYYNFSVTNYPLHIDLSTIAFKKFSHFNQTPPRLVLGGKFIGFMSNMLGWKIARTIRFVLREI